MIVGQARPLPLRDGPLAAAAVVGAVALAAAATRIPPPETLLLAGGVAAVALLGVCLVAHDAVVGLGFAVLGVVSIEPGPPDGVFLVVLAVSGATGALALRRVRPDVLALLAAFAVLNVLSAIGAPDVARAARYLGITVYLLALAVWVAAYVDSSRRAGLVLRCLLAGAGGTAALTLVALVVPFPGHQHLLTDDGLRAKGLFKDPNVFGPFLVPLALVVVEELRRPRLLRLGRAVTWAVLGVLTAGILVAYSRAAWVNFAIGLAIVLGVLVLREGRRAMTVMVVVPAVLGGLLLATISFTGSGDFLAERARVQTYDTDRFAAQASGARLAEQHPLGVGPGQIEVVQPLATHSVYVRTLAEQGLGGLVVFGGVLVLTLGLACRNVVRGWDTWGIGSAPLLGAWCGLLVNSAVVDTIHWRHLWVVAGLIWAGGPRPQISSAGAENR